MSRGEDPSVSGARPEQANSTRVNDSVAPPFCPGKQKSFDIRRQRNAVAPQTPFLLLALAACGGGGGGGTDESLTSAQSSVVAAAPAPAQQAPTFDNEHGGTAADSAWERMRGTDGERDLFKIDDVPGANARAVDVPMSFSQSDGDMLRFGSDDSAADSVDKNLYVRLGTTGNPGTALDDLYIYGVQGDASSLLAVIFNAGTTFELKPEDVWENATITPFIETHDGAATSKQTLTGDDNFVEVFKVDGAFSARDGADVIQNFKDGQDKLEFSPNLSHIWVMKDGGNLIIKGANDPNLLAAIKAGTIPESTSMNSVRATPNNVLAVIEDFTGTFDVNDLVDTGIIVTDIV